MCQPGEHILFCTCEDEEGLKPTDSGVKWILYRHVRNILTLTEKQSRMMMVMGKAMSSSNQIGGQLSQEEVLDSLNNSQAFDFEYEPKSGDILKLIDRNNIHSKFMFFSFDGSRWVATVGFLHNFISMSDGSLNCMPSTYESSVLKQAFTEQEVYEKAELFMKKKEFDRAPRLSWIGILKLFGYKKYE